MGWYRKVKSAIAKLPPRSRRGKLVRNVICILLLVMVGWTLLGAPALFPRQTFRSLARAYMMDDPEILAVLSAKELDLMEEPQWANGRLPDNWYMWSQMERMLDITVGQDGDQLLIVRREEAYSNEQWWDINAWPVPAERKDGVAITVIEPYYSGNKTYGLLCMVQTELPEAGGIRLDVEHYRWYDGKVWSSSCSGTGEVHENGVFVVLATGSGTAAVEQQDVDYFTTCSRFHVIITNAAGETIYDETLIV